MKRLWLRTRGLWRRYRGVPAEAVLVVIFSQLPVLLASFFSLAGATEETLDRTSFFLELQSRYSASDVFIYSTGVLGSAVVFFVLRYKEIANLKRIIFTGVIAPLVVIFLSALIPASASLTGEAPNSFIRSFSGWMLAFLLISWLLALFEQRNIESKRPDFEDADAVASMSAEAKEKIG